MSVLLNIHLLQQREHHTTRVVNVVCGTLLHHGMLGYVFALVQSALRWIPRMWRFSPSVKVLIRLQRLPSLAFCWQACQVCTDITADVQPVTGQGTGWPLWNAESLVLQGRVRESGWVGPRISVLLEELQFLVVSVSRDNIFLEQYHGLNTWMRCQSISNDDDISSVVGADWPMHIPSMSHYWTCLLAECIMLSNRWPSIRQIFRRPCKRVTMNLLSSENRSVPPCGQYQRWINHAQFNRVMIWRAVKGFQM